MAIRVKPNMVWRGGLLGIDPTLEVAEPMTQAEQDFWAQRENETLTWKAEPGTWLELPGQHTFWGLVDERRSLLIFSDAQHDLILSGTPVAWVLAHAELAE